MTDQLDDAQLFLARFAIGSDEITSDRIGSLAQLYGQPRLDRLQGLLESVFSAHQFGAVVEYPRQLAFVEIAKYRKVPDDITDDAELGIGQLAVGRRHDHHRVDQRAVVVEHAGPSRVAE